MQYVWAIARTSMRLELRMCGGKWWKRSLEELKVTLKMHLDQLSACTLCMELCDISKWLVQLKN